MADPGLVFLEPGVLLFKEPGVLAFSLACCKCPPPPPDVGCCEGFINLPGGPPPDPLASLLVAEIISLSGNAACWGFAMVNDTVDLDPADTAIWRSVGCLATGLGGLRYTCQSATSFELSWEPNPLGGGPCGPCPFSDSDSLWTPISIQCDPFEAVYEFTFNETEAIPGSNPCITAGCNSAATIRVRITKRPGSPP